MCLWMWCVMVSKHIVCIFSRFLKVNYRHGNRPNIIAILSLKCAHLVPKKLPRNEFLLQRPLYPHKVYLYYFLNKSSQVGSTGTFRRMGLLRFRIRALTSNTYWCNTTDINSVWRMKIYKKSSKSKNEVYKFNQRPSLPQHLTIKVKILQDLLAVVISLFNAKWSQIL